MSWVPVGLHVWAGCTPPPSRLKPAHVCVYQTTNVIYSGYCSRCMMGNSLGISPIEGRTPPRPRPGESDLYWTDQLLWGSGPDLWNCERTGARRNSAWPDVDLWASDAELYQSAGVQMARAARACLRSVPAPPSGQCAICLEDWADAGSEGPAAVQLPCAHCFHAGCMHACIDHGGQACPVCRQSLITHASPGSRGKQ